MIRKKALKKELDTLRLEYAKTQEFLTDILTYKAGEKWNSPASVLNPYRDRATLIAEIVRKYHGYSESGSQLIQRIVDTRAAFSLGRGIRARATDELDTSPELTFINEFLSSSGLRGQFAQQLAVEKELEGQVLLRLDPVMAGGAFSHVRVNFISWNDTHYAVDFRDGHYGDVEAVHYTDPVTNDEVTIPSERTVFMRFNARANAEAGIPTLSGLLQEAEDIDRALRDWRQLNRYFASPTPYFKTADMEEARDLYERLSDPSVNWKVGKVFVGPAEFSLVTMDSSGVESLRKEIETKLKVLSGGSGVPIQFLGFPEFMSNRATAENTMEPVEAVSIAEQQTWLGGMQELFDKVIGLRNALEKPSAARLIEGRVQPHIPFVTARQLQNLKDFYLPAFTAGYIPPEQFLSRLPDSN